MRSLRPLILLSVCVTCSIVVAASKSDKADRVVNALLEQEARGEVHHRRDQLGDLVDQTDRARWAAGYVKTADGWQRFDTPQPTDERLREYETRRGTEPLTAEQHLQLANWCRDQKLQGQSRSHLWAVVTSHPDSSALWQRLGFELVNGVWMTREERRERTAEQLAVKQAYRVWSARARNLAARLSDENPGTQATARTDLDSITDVMASPALEAHLSMESMDSALSLVNWLSQHPQTATTFALIRQSLDSPWTEVRTMAADSLRHRRLDHTMPPLLYSLSKPIDVTVYQSNSTLQTGATLVSAVLEQESWNAIERRKYAVKLGRQFHLWIGLRRGLTRVARYSWQPDFQEKNDLDQLRNDIQLSLIENSREMNRVITNRNERASTVLSQISGLNEDRNPQEWWSSWSSLSATEPPVTKRILEVSETERVISPPPQIHLHPSCLTAETPVMTYSGSHSVESLQIGDLVLAKDIDTGELSYKPVIRTTVRSPQPLVTLHTKADSIRATLGHYFWVSGQGWRMAKEIKVGDRLHGVDGTITVTDVSTGGREAVYNLVVEGANTYFVGEGKILSHDVTPPVPTDIIVPGLAAR